MRHCAQIGKPDDNHGRNRQTLVEMGIHPGNGCDIFSMSIPELRITLPARCFCRAMASLAVRSQGWGLVSDLESMI